MYVHPMRSKGRTYYEVVESYQDPITRKIRQRTLAYLGKFATVAEAFNDAEARYFSMRNGRVRTPFTRADQLAWKRLDSLWKLFISPDFRVDDFDMRRAKRIFRERTRWSRFMSSKAKANRLAAAARATLDIGIDATPDEIRAARDRLARRHHPDLGGDPSIMIQINEAYETLTE